MRSSLEEDEEDCEEMQPSKQHAVNGNATNGLLEEGSPSECSNWTYYLLTCVLCKASKIKKNYTFALRESCLSPPFPKKDEMETDEQDEESSQDQDLPSENDNSQSEDSVGGDNELENGVVSHQNSIKGMQLASQRKRLFTFQFNNMGKTDLSLIKEDTRQIRFDEGHLRLSGE